MNTIGIPAHRDRLRRALAVLGLIGGLFAAGAVPATAAPATHTVSTHTTKPVPAPPKGVPVGTAVVPKPHVKSNVVRPMTPWSVSLADSASSTWATEYVTLTATANSDVGPTPYSIYIYDLYTDARVASCGSGTTCQVAVTQGTATCQEYVAYIAGYSLGYPPANVQAESGVVLVCWNGVTVSLAAALHTLPIGAVSTLTATTSVDVDPTPFWTELWDTTTSPPTLLATCGVGTTCSATVSQSIATTHTYVATVGANSTTYPPPALQSTSATNYITWSNDGWTLSLAAPTITFGPESVTATANVNVGPTPDSIVIYDENTGSALGSVCGSGSTCTVAFTPSYSGDSLVAFIGNGFTTLPPTNIDASSNTVTTYLSILH